MEDSEALVGNSGGCTSDIACTEAHRGCHYARAKRIATSPAHREPLRFMQGRSGHDHRNHHAGFRALEAKDDLQARLRRRVVGSKVEGDVDDHVLLAADEAAMTHFQQDAADVDAVICGGALCVPKKA